MDLLLASVRAMQDTLDVIKRGHHIKDDAAVEHDMRNRRCTFAELKEVVGFPRYFEEEAKYKTE